MSRATRSPGGAASLPNHRHESPTPNTFICRDQQRLPMPCRRDDDVICRTTAKGSEMRRHHGYRGFERQQLHARSIQCLVDPEATSSFRRPRTTIAATVQQLITLAPTSRIGRCDIACDWIASTNHPPDHGDRENHNSVRGDTMSSSESTLPRKLADSVASSTGTKRATGFPRLITTTLRRVRCTSSRMARQRALNARAEIERVGFMTICHADSDETAGGKNRRRPRRLKGGRGRG
jgi:hypothetical protein